MINNVDRPPTLLVSWAHAPNDGVEVDDWRHQVLRLTVGLRHMGVDAEVDLFHLHDRGVEWTRWGPQRVLSSEVVLVAVNRAWRQRFEGSNDPTTGAGAAAEANVLLGLFAENQQSFRERLILAVLPGGSVGDIPTQLRGQPFVKLDGFGRDDLEDLLRLIFRKPAYEMPPVGGHPELVPREQLASILDASRATGTNSKAGSSGDARASEEILSIALEVSAADGDESETRKLVSALKDVSADRSAQTDATPPVSEAPRTGGVPGVPSDGQDVVLRQLAANSNGEAVGRLLAEVSTWEGVTLNGIRRRRSSPGDAADFSEYLRIDSGGVAIGYLYVSSGRLNPRVSDSTYEALEAVAPSARRVSASNRAFRTVVQVVDTASLAEALVLLRRAHDDAR